MKYFPYFYKITIVRVLDGDTVEADFDLGFNITHRVTVRLAGYDAPETFRPKTEAEAKAGAECRHKLYNALTYRPDSLYCRSTKIDLYGRSTGIIYIKDHLTGDCNSVNDIMSYFIEQNGYTKKELRKKTLDEELHEVDSWGPSA